MRPDVDVVVAGAGPAGCAAAIALAGAGRRVLLADPAHDRRPALTIGESLPAGAAIALGELGLAGRLEGAIAVASTGTTARWGGDRALERDAVADPHGHGWHLDRAAFDGWLRAEAGAAGADRRPGRVVVDPGREHGVVRVHVGDDPVACRWVVDATGRRGAVARRHRARAGRADRLVALYAPLGTGAADVDARTRVEATPTGWWYSAPIGPGRRIVAFLTDADLVDPAWRTAAGFRALLGTTGHVLPPTVDAADRASGPADAPKAAPAHGAHLAPAVGDGWLAVGDAAVAFDPLSSQGIVNALLTGRRAALAVHAHLDGDAAPVHEYAHMLDTVWSAYERNRADAYALERRWPTAPFWARRLG